MAVLFFGSCKEDRLLTYDRTDNVYFKHKRWGSGGLLHTTSVGYEGINYTIEARISEAIDSIVFSFGRFEEGIDEAITLVPVVIVGDIANIDRRFGYKINETSTAMEGEDFRILDAFIPAGKISGGFIVELSRKNIEKDAFKYIDLELVPNENFVTDYDSIPRSSASTKIKTSTLTFRLWFNNGLLQPKYWSSYQVGYFSTRKAQLLIEHTSLTDEGLYSDETPQMMICIAIRDEFTRWFNDENIAGRTIYEADGRTPMTLASTPPTPVPAP